MKWQITFFLGLLSIVAFLTACGEDEGSVDYEEFVSFLHDIGTVTNGDSPTIGFSLWSFSRDGVVIFGTVDSRVGNQWIAYFFAGDYTLKQNGKGEYIAKCHFFSREARWIPGGDVIIQVKHDEDVTVRLKRDGQFLLINGERFGIF